MGSPFNEDLDPISDFHILNKNNILSQREADEHGARPRTYAHAKSKSGSEQIHGEYHNPARSRR